ITPPERYAEVADWLASSSSARLSVLTSLQAKGMEYDGVLVVAPSEIRGDSPAGVRTLYVALSRATHRLITIDLVR
ncbi:MAG: ATP-dependent DNA helicase, partial [Actinobacteria bacterium]